MLSIYGNILISVSLDRTLAQDIVYFHCKNDDLLHNTGYYSFPSGSCYTAEGCAETEILLRFVSSSKQPFWKSIFASNQAFITRKQLACKTFSDWLAMILGKDNSKSRNLQNLCVQYKKKPYGSLTVTTSSAEKNLSWKMILSIQDVFLNVLQGKALNKQRKNLIDALATNEKS